MYIATSLITCAISVVDCGSPMHVYTLEKQLVCFCVEVRGKSKTSGNIWVFNFSVLAAPQLNSVTLLGVTQGVPLSPET